MEIESIEVIPMNKETIFEDTEEDFEVFGITTNFNEWFEKTLTSKDKSMLYDSEVLLEFAKKQQMYMIMPTAKIGDTVYLSRTIRVQKHQIGYVKLKGPLYEVQEIEEWDTSKEKIPGTYLNEETFKVEEGLVYPKKKVYMIRYGEKET